MMEKDELIQEYFKKISSSLISDEYDVSEILYEDRYSPIMMEDLMKMVLPRFPYWFRGRCLTMRSPVPGLL